MTSVPPLLRATCRVQLNASFDFRALRETIPYLARLGVSHVYASPILRARPKSMHGYDVVDPTMLNPELGADADWRALIDELRAHEMGVVLDIVPNHMGTGESNPYWEDVLAHGPASRYAKWFDIDWRPPQRELRNRVLLPVLGDSLGKVVERGEISLQRMGDRVRVRYFQQSFPLSPDSEHSLPENLAAVSQRDLRALLTRQHYRLVHWQRGAREINYRRFFDINDLVSVRQEDPDVFTATHGKILELVRAGDVNALRIDHIDGLLDPRGYLERLRAEVGPSVPIFVEKILSPGEHLRREWPVEGTTGYEFLNDLEGIFIDPSGYDRIERAYLSILNVRDRLFDFHHIAMSGKLRILRGPLAADVARVTRLLRETLSGSPEAQPMPDESDLTVAVVELLAALPVYRTYIDDRTAVAAESDRAIIDAAMHGAMHRREAPPAALSVLGAVLRQGVGGERAATDRSRRLAFIGRFQQTSGPATAKGVEDTALYRYVPLVSRNEVGGDPERDLREAVTTLHVANRLRGHRWPLTLTATNTHDTKRSADVRARLDVLSEIPDEWEAHVRRWHRVHAHARTKVRGRNVPDANTEYLIYETLLGIWPLEDDDEGRRTLGERAGRYLEKAVREAKTHTSWTTPDEPTEHAIAHFLNIILDRQSPFVSEISALARRIAPAGLWNSLSRVAVHLTAPGTPDLYQGDELWNFALVDPDNRRPVDWPLRRRLLEQLDFSSGSATSDEPRLVQLVDEPADGRIKLYVTTRLLALRREREQLFRAGGYDPLVAAGRFANHVFAFVRRIAEEATITVVPRLPLTLTGDSRPPVGARAWQGTYLPLPQELDGARWRCSLTGQIVAPHPDSALPGLPLDSVLKTLPVAVLVLAP